MNIGESVNKIIKEIGVDLLIVFENPESRKEIESVISGAENKLRTYIEKNHSDSVLIASKKDSGNVSAEKYLWLTHVLDGSMNISRGIPYFGTSIAIGRSDKARNIEILYAVIYLPTTKELIWAEKGKGAFINERRVVVSKTSSLKGCLGSIAPTIDRYMSPVLKSLAKYGEKEEFRLESEGAGAFHARYLADGARDFWAFEHDPAVKNIYNLTSAASLIIEEAGGKVTTLKGEKWKPGSYSFLGSNGFIHEELLKAFNG